MRRIRAFVAIPLSAEVMKKAAQVQRTLAESLPGMNWVRSEGMHLTLRFFASIDEETLDRIGEVMLSVGRLFPPFQIEARGVGAFPSAGRPRVIWLGLRHDEPLRNLHAALEEELEGIGIPAEERRFKPHLTLGRARRRLPPAQEVLKPYQDFSGGTMPADRLILFESRLQPSGALHLPLKTVALAGQV
jgi:2'-5' RNA ligase